MASSYTHKVPEGMSFKDFALTCARAFGACVDMRESPLGPALPEEVKPSSYHSDRVAEARKELAQLMDLSPEERRCLIKDEDARSRSNQLEAHKRAKQAAEAYTTMVKQVKTWVPPTPDHENLKAFMLTQLQESIDFHHIAELEEAAAVDVDKALVWKIEGLFRAIRYHEAEHEKEVKVAAERTQWLKDLRNSLPKD